METAANTSKAIAQQVAAQQTGSNLNSAANSAAASTASSAAIVSGPSLKYGKPPTVFTSIEARKLPKGWSIKSGDPLKLFEELNKKAVFPAESVIYDKKWLLESDSKANANTAATATHNAVDLKTDKEYVDTHPKMFKGALVSQIMITRTANNPEKKLSSALMIRILFEEPGKKSEKSWDWNYSAYFYDLDGAIYDAVPGSAHYGHHILAGTNNLTWGFGEQELNDLEPKITKYLQFCIGDMDLRLARDFFKFLGIVLNEEEASYFQAMTCHQNPEIDERAVETKIKKLLGVKNYQGLVTWVQSMQEDGLDSSMGSLDDKEKMEKESEELDYDSHPSNKSDRFNKDSKRAFFDLGVSLGQPSPKHAIEIFDSIKPQSIYYWIAQEKIIKMALEISKDTIENIKERRQYREKAIAKLCYLFQNGILVKSDRDRAKFFEVVNSIASLLKEHAGVETVSLSEDLFDLLKEGKDKIFEFFVDHFTNLYIASAKKIRMYRDPAYKPSLQSQKPDQKMKTDEKESADSAASMVSATSTAAVNSSQGNKKENEKPLSKFLMPLQKDLVIAPGWEVVKGELGKLAEENYLEPVIIKRIEVKDPKAVGIDVKVNQENAASDSAKQKEEGDDAEKLAKEKKELFSQIILQREWVAGTQESVITLSFFKPLTADFKKEPDTQRVFALRKNLYRVLFGRYVYDGLSKLNFCYEFNANSSQNKFTLTYRLSAMRETMVNRFFDTLVTEGIFSDAEAQVFVKYFGHRFASVEEQSGLMEIQKQLQLAESAEAIKDSIACNQAIDKASSIAKKIQDQALIEILPYLYPCRINLDGTVTVVPAGEQVPFDVSTVFDLGVTLSSKYKTQAIRVLKMLPMASPSFFSAQDKITNIAIEISGIPKTELLSHNISEEEQWTFRELAIRTLVVKLFESTNTNNNNDDVDVNYFDQTLLYRLLAVHAGYESMDTNNSLFSTFVIKPKFTLGAALELAIFMANKVWSLNPENPEFSGAKSSGSTVAASVTTSTSASTIVSASVNASANASSIIVTDAHASALKTSTVNTTAIVTTAINSPFAQSPAAPMLTGFNMSTARAPTLGATVSNSSAATAANVSMPPATETSAAVSLESNAASITKIHSKK